MSKQTLNRIMKVFIGATLIWVLLSLLNNQDQDSKSVSNRIKEVFTDFDSTTVKTLKITSPDGGITELTYLTDTWEVNGLCFRGSILTKIMGRH